MLLQKIRGKIFHEFSGPAAGELVDAGERFMQKRALSDVRLPFERTVYHAEKSC